MNDADDHVVTGEDAPPDVVIDPVQPDQDPADVYEDPEMGDMPDDLPPGSFHADDTDTHGAHDHPGGDDGE